MKSTPEGLNKHFDVKEISIKSKVKRSQKINLKNIKTFSNIFLIYLKCLDYQNKKSLSF